MSLLKLSEIRANKPGVSLIHFVAHQTENTASAPDPNGKYTCQLHAELPSLEEASR